MNGARPKNKEGRRRFRASVLLGLGVGALGILLSHWPPAESLELKGLDGLFLLRGKQEPAAGICIVAIDPTSYDELGVPQDKPWPRGLHADLIRTLKEEGARAIAFDVVFDIERDPAEDRDLAAAIKEAGIVGLASSVVTTVDPRFRVAQVTEPIPLFSEAAAAIGQAGFPPDPDGRFRRTWLVRDGRPSLALAAYEIATHDRSLEDPTSRLIDYYGPGRTIRTESYYQALSPAQYLPGVFKDKVVFVGLSQPSAPGPAAKDAFVTPFSREDNPQTYGVEIHATVTANLLEGRKIELLRPWVEAIALMSLPLIAVMTFMALRPLLGAFALILLELGVVAAASLVFTVGRVWVPVVIPAVIQLPIAYVASLIWYYLTTARERERIRRAFSFYLSPKMIERITADPASLNLGGEEIIATALFTDVKGFTPIAESMPAHETAAMLNAYFSELTRHVFAEGGTLIKFIGDAVFAIWGAPLRMDDHATPACAAALAMARQEEESDRTGVLNPWPGVGSGAPPGVSPGAGSSPGTGSKPASVTATHGPESSDSKTATHGSEPGDSKTEPGPSKTSTIIGPSATPGERVVRSGVRLITRIGVHTGPMLVGNLGSEQRFDYTAIGDAVNLASRLEGLNKQFGTRAIVSGATLSRTDGRFVVRSLGRVRVVGKHESIEIFELLGSRGQATRPGPEAISRFERALADFQARRFESAARGFEETASDCGDGGDPPSHFYLGVCRKLMESPPEEDWDGAVVFESK